MNPNQVPNVDPECEAPCGSGSRRRQGLGCHYALALTCNALNAGCRAPQVKAGGGLPGYSPHPRPRLRVRVRVRSQLSDVRIGHRTATQPGRDHEQHHHDEDGHHGRGDQAPGGARHQKKDERDQTDHRDEQDRQPDAGQRRGQAEYAVLAMRAEHRAVDHHRGQQDHRRDQGERQDDEIQARAPQLISANRS